MSRPIILTSPLAPESIATRLRDTLGDRDDTPKGKGVTGQGSEQEMMLFVYRPNFQNSFATNLTATLEAAAAPGSGTRIEGRIGTPRSGTVFLGCWFGFLTVFVLLAGGGVIASGAGAEMWPALAIPLGMMGFGWLLWKLGTWTAKADEAAILDFLARTIEARETA